MSNALQNETSPYLLQHANNPVDWLPWGDEALQRAREADKPLLVSIGYSSCHWCHVMAHESFEDPQVAAQMNANFICVKVDREERPDVDAICMEAIQAMTGQGGWPLNIFLTPEQQPIHGGTYFPPQQRQGLPSWTMVLEAVADAWRDRRVEIREQLKGAAAQLGASVRVTPAETLPSSEYLDSAIELLARNFDSIQGGFGGAPKFPPHSALLFLQQFASGGGSPEAESEAIAGAEEQGGGHTATQRLAATMARTTLTAMASGGINDQIGGGFHRYAVDGTWTVPHFEKMLYDNALLARAYARAWQTWGDQEFRNVAEETLEFISRELVAPDGGFMAALDADSEGEEGLYYRWNASQIGEVLSSGDAEIACRWFSISDEQARPGNGHEADPNEVLEDRGPRPDEETAQRIRKALLDARSQRTYPGLDNKRIAAWNGLAITAFAEAAAIFDRSDLLNTARQALVFVSSQLVRTEPDSDGKGLRLYRSFAQGKANHDALLEDYAFLLEGAVAVVEAAEDGEEISFAIALAETLIEQFSDAENGGFFSTAHDAEPLLARRKEFDDAPIPAGGAAAARGLARLAALTGEDRYRQHSESWLRLISELGRKLPQAVAYSLLVLDQLQRPQSELAIVGTDTEQRALLRRFAWSKPRPGLVFASGDGKFDRGIPLLSERSGVNGQAAAYLCERFTCKQPVTSVDELAQLLA